MIVSTIATSAPGGEFLLLLLVLGREEEALLDGLLENAQ
jgi:hypothetical protein